MWAPHTGPPVSFRRLASRAAKPRGQFRAESEVFRLRKTLRRSPEPVRDFEALWPVGLFRFVSVRSTCSFVLSICSERPGSGRVAHLGRRRTYSCFPLIHTSSRAVSRPWQGHRKRGLHASSRSRDIAVGSPLRSTRARAPIAAAPMRVPRPHGRPRPVPLPIADERTCTCGSPGGNAGRIRSPARIAHRRDRPWRH